MGTPPFGALHRHSAGFGLEARGAAWGGSQLLLAQRAGGAAAGGGGRHHAQTPATGTEAFFCSLCGWCVVGVWLVCGWCVVGVCFLVRFCLVSLESLCCGCICHAGFVLSVLSVSRFPFCHTLDKVSLLRQLGSDVGFDSSLGLRESSCQRMALAAIVPCTICEEESTE